MFKLVVIFALVAAVSARPGYLHSPIAFPLATSYSTRVDIHSKPLLAYHAAPVIAAAPIIHSAPIIAPLHGLHGVPLVSAHSFHHW
ncbi:PREDICTED: larval cuticle protein F1-like [Nicrophorus vespilloides]|uniref:Larval cuticle protein F1-like n=1 Tax=Nicrophorus vespilloides TaxID=110193 RepID=A0ABM1MLL7_NICVS|nr:PREDICTED: larval cuticle protein F1-like [Nicrophorus vespilloides]